MKAKSRLSGIVSATMIAARKLTRKKISTISTSDHAATSMLCSTVSIVSRTRSLRS